MLHICNHISALGIGMFYIYMYICIDTKIIIVSCSNNKGDNAEDNECDSVTDSEDDDHNDIGDNDSDSDDDDHNGINDNHSGEEVHFL